MNYIEYLILLIPVLFGCIFAKRYNVIMGVVATIYFGCLISFLNIKIDFSQFITNRDVLSGLELISEIYVTFIYDSIELLIRKLELDLNKIMDVIVFSVETFVFLVILSPSCKLRRYRKEKSKRE
jgi:hypothetical protein